MLPDLLNVPETDQQWAIWSFAHKDHHALIRAAIQAQKQVNLPEYQLDPIPPDDVTGWLVRNQQSHNDMNGAIGLQSSDLQEADLRDPKKRSDWINSHYLEHQTASSVLRI